ETSVGPRLHLRGLEGAESGLLDIDRQADPPTRAGRPRVHPGLLGPRARVVQAAQQLVEEPGEIAGVVDGADPERLGAAVVRHLVRADQIAAADLGRVDAEPRRRPVEEALADEVTLRAAGGAQGPGRRLVGHDRPEIARIARDAVRAR